VIVLVKKSNRLLFASLGFDGQSIPGLRFVSDKRSQTFLRVKVCAEFDDVGISGVTRPRLPAPMTVTRQLISRELRCPAIAGVQAAQPLLTHELARGLEEVGIVRRRVVRNIRQDRRLRATGHVRPGCVVVPAEFGE